MGQFHIPIVHIHFNGRIFFDPENQFYICECALDIAISTSAKSGIFQLPANKIKEISFFYKKLLTISTPRHRQAPLHQNMLST